jgi:hypothetical protein
MMLASTIFFAHPVSGKPMQPEANGIVITTAIPDTFYADSFYSIPLTATYGGNGTLIWTVVSGPSNLQDVSDTLVWSPTLSNVGKDTIIISVSDGSVSDTMKKAIAVLAAPVLAISTVFPDTFYVDSLYSIHMTATHAGNAPLTWTVLKKPSGMLDISNTLIWAPGESDIGNDTIIIAVSNDSVSDTLTKPIAVEPKGGTLARANENLGPEVLSARVSHGNGSIDLIVGIPGAGNPAWEIDVCDLSGRAVCRKVFSGFGYHRISLTSAELKRGFYVVRVSNGSTFLTRRALFM